MIFKFIGLSMGYFRENFQKFAFNPLALFADYDTMKASLDTTGNIKRQDD